MSDARRKAINKMRFVQYTTMKPQKKTLNPFRYQMLKFEAEQRRRRNEEMGESSVDEIIDSTQHLSMSEQTLGPDTDFKKFWPVMKLENRMD